MDILDKQLIRSIKWLIKIRWIGILAILAILFAAREVSSFSFSSEPILILAGTAWLYNIIFAIDIHFREKKEEEDRLKRIPVLQRIANIQIDLDLLILIGFIHFSGGIESPLILFLMFHMITSGLLLSVKTGLFQATLTILLYFALVFVEFVGYLPHVCLLGEDSCYRGNAQYVITKLILLGGTLFLAIGLSSFLGQKLKKQERELYYMYRKMRSMAMKDELTQVFNYRYFRQQLKSELDRSKRYLHTVSLIMLDVDNLKKFNDNYGHLVGSESLTRASKIMVEGTRISDTVAKYGGDEFVIIAPETDKSQARTIAERLRENVENEQFPAGVFDKNGEPKRELTISIGIASFPDDAVNDETLIEAADRAVYEAKRLGKNQVCIYSGERIVSLPTKKV